MRHTHSTTRGTRGPPLPMTNKTEVRSASRHVPRPSHITSNQNSNSFQRILCLSPLLWYNHPPPKYEYNNNHPLPLLTLLPPQPALSPRELHPGFPPSSAVSAASAAAGGLTDSRHPGRRRRRRCRRCERAPPVRRCEGARARPPGVISQRRPPRLRGWTRPQSPSCACSPHPAARTSCLSCACARASPPGS